jgi:hypothetical protein
MRDPVMTNLLINSEKTMNTESKDSFITITLGVRGYFAVLIGWEDDHTFEEGGYWEPWHSGIGSYRTAEAAIPEAKDWAESEEMAFQFGNPDVIEDEDEYPELAFETDH